jgi:hypothetical protein
MDHMQLIKENPLSDELISAGAFVGYVLITTHEVINLKEKTFALHLANGTAERMLRIPNDQIESFFDTRHSSIYQKEGYGFGQLAAWFLSKFKMRRKPFRIASNLNFASLEDHYITEKQAMGYMLLAATSLDFLFEQRQIFELETHLQMRMVPTEKAILAFRRFISEFQKA